MIALLIILAFCANAFYLGSFRFLMTKLESGATTYWESIGRPDSFSGKDVSSILSNLYSAKMGDACRNAGLEGLLRSVRISLPVAFVATGYMLYVLSRLLNAGA